MKAPKDATIQATLDGGINGLDIAEIYSASVAECSLAEGLKAADKRPGEVIIATKWFPLLW